MNSDEMESMLLRVTLDTTAESAKQYTVHRRGGQKSKLCKLFSKIIQGFSGLIVSNRLRVIYCLSVLNE